MSDVVHEVGVIATASSTHQQPAIEKVAVKRGTRWGRVFGNLVSMAIVVGCAVAVVGLGQATGWKIPKASALRGETAAEESDWCKEHGVPESICVECRPELLSPLRTYKWCQEHGIPECPLCHPDIAEFRSRADVTDDDRDRAAKALAFAPRGENDPKCKLHLRHLQLASEEMANRLGFAYAPVVHGPVEEVLEAPGEIRYDPTRIARAISPVSGTVWRVERQIGDKVKRGEVLAIVDSVAVGKAKSEYQQALVQLDLRRESLAKLRPMAGSTIPLKDVRSAEAEVDEAEVRASTAEEALANLGLPLRAEVVRGLPPADLARRMQFLGFPAPIAGELAGRIGSSNLIPVTAPLDGEVVARTAVKDEVTDSTKPLFLIADSSRMWLNMRLRPEDADRVKPGQLVRFQHPGHTGTTSWDPGVVVWISPAADEKTRTVPVRVNLPNPSDKHHANTFGTAEVVLRDEKRAWVIPSEAIHWEGCCHIVFVLDKNYHKADGLKVFHVRKVRLGAKDVPTPNGPVTEVIAGLLPREWVVTAGSGILRSELLKNDLGAG